MGGEVHSSRAEIDGHMIHAVHRRGPLQKFSHEHASTSADRNQEPDGLRCDIVITSSKEIPKEAGVRHENFKGVPRISSGVGNKRLNAREGYSPVRQKKRGQAPDHAKAIQAEVQKLVGEGIMREVYYHDWLANPVMVKKHDGSWRMCVDFTDLNKACPQDCYPLLEIDWKVKSLCGYPFKCFLDAYKGYHQIQMAELDEEKTNFHTSQGVYCYTKMPFGLKNVGATYQCLVDKAFGSQVSRNIEMYVDDLVIKSYTEAEMLRDIEETFRTLRKINMKLNPKKCTFGAVEGMFLGYTISPEGMKPCSNKTEVVLQLPSRTSLPATKTTSVRTTLLVAPKPKEELIVYLSASYGAVSAVLMTERGTVQTPVYFITRPLQGPELNYTLMEKLVLSLVFAAKRLRRALYRKWSAMLGEHNITYRPRTLVKGQILADFLVEKPDENPPDTPVVETPLEPLPFLTMRQSMRQDAGLDSARRWLWGMWNVSVESKWVESKFLGTEIDSQDNGKQFSDNPFKDWCKKLNITQRFTSVNTRQSNRLVKRIVLRPSTNGLKSSHGDTLSLWGGTTEQKLIPTELGCLNTQCGKLELCIMMRAMVKFGFLAREAENVAAICEARRLKENGQNITTQELRLTFRLESSFTRSNDEKSCWGWKLGSK
ncbi:reverse transcriptase domain-containing protein [Tanacetum coccineum]